MNYTEYYNKDNLQKLQNLDKSTLETIIKDDEKEDWNVSYIIKNIKAMKAINRVSYKTTNNCGFGRKYSKKLSLQMLPRELRGYLLEETGYIDYDIKNAHFTIINKLCEKNKIPNNYIKEYVNDREEILKRLKSTKHKMCIMLYIDKPECYGNKYLEAFTKELADIKTQLINLYNDKINVNTKEKKNKKSSEFSSIIGYFEDEILMSVVNHYKLKDCGLIFDGFVSREKLDLEELKKLTGFEWAIKPFETLNIENETDEYTEAKNKMEKNNFVVLQPFQRFSRINENTPYEVQTKVDFEDRNKIYAHTNQMGLYVPIMARWMMDENKRAYHYCDFNPDPNFDDDRTYNTFKPFQVHKMETENIKDISVFLDLLLNICGDSKENFRYLSNYLAQLFQQPHINSNVSIVIKGAQGCGKDTLTYIINKIFGMKNNYLIKLEGLTAATGNFNEVLSNKLVVQFNEVSGKDGYKFQDWLKDSITKETNVINKKFQSVTFQTNYIRYFIFSNQNVPVAVEQTDRRFFIVDTTTKYINNPEFWNMFYELISDDDYIYSIYKYFMDIDISEFKPQKIPMTYEKSLMKKRTINPLHVFLQNQDFSKDWLDHSIRKKKYKAIQCKDLFDIYLNDCEGIPSKSSKFTNDLEAIKGVYVKRIKVDGRTTGCTWFCIREEELKEHLSVVCKMDSLEEFDKD